RAVVGGGGTGGTVCGCALRILASPEPSRRPVPPGRGQPAGREHALRVLAPTERRRGRPCRLASRCPLWRDRARRLRGRARVLRPLPGRPPGTTLRAGH